MPVCTYLPRNKSYACGRYWKTVRVEGNWWNKKLTKIEVNDKKFKALPQRNGYIEFVYKAFIMRYIQIAICLALLSFGCGKEEPITIPSLVPEKPGDAPNYWCTWYWQNYLIRKGQPVTNPDPKTVYSNPAARDQLNENTVFGEDGMARIMLPKTRSDYYFLIDHGWQDKRIKENTFFTGIMDTLDFPRYARLSPRDRIKRMNEDLKALGW